MRNIFPVVAALILGGYMAAARAQEASITDPGLDAAIREALQKPTGLLTEQDLLSLTNLEACCRNIRSVQGLEAARNLTTLSLDQNQLGNFSLASPLTNLVALNLGFNSLTNVSLPEGLTNLSKLILEANLLSELSLPKDLSGLRKLDLANNQLSSFPLSSNLAGLTSLDLGENLFTSFTVPEGMTNLILLTLSFNQLTNLNLPADLSQLEVLDIGNNQLTELTLPAGLTNLQVLIMQTNQVTSLTLPEDMQALSLLFADGNPLTVVLSESLAAHLTDVVAALRNNNNISVFEFPSTIQLGAPRLATGGFGFALTGPPGRYQVLSSTNLIDWAELGIVTNTIGVVRISDPEASSSEQKFYQGRALR